MTPFGRNRLWFGLFVAAVFVVGAATGAGLARFARFGPPFGRPFGPPPFGHRRPPPPPSPAMLADRLTRELGLSPEQRTQVEAALRQGAERMDQFHRSTGDAFGKLRRELDADIERVLTPEQQARYRALRPGPREEGPPLPPPPRE